MELKLILVQLFLIVMMATPIPPPIPLTIILLMIPVNIVWMVALVACMTMISVLHVKLDGTLTEEDIIA